MKRRSDAVLGLILLSLGACSGSAPLVASPADLDLPDLDYTFAGDSSVASDDGPPQPLCLDDDPSCTLHLVYGVGGDPFGLGSDATPDPDEADHAVVRDGTGALILDGYHLSASYHSIWIANTNQGTVSVIDSRTVREIARYPSVTCASLKTGSAMACDGMNGCCAMDDYPRWQARQSKQAPPGRQSVQTTQNYPSRTSVDLNGDLFISNRAFGGQSSVTKIAGEARRCIDRNKDGKLETSSDIDGNGQIDTDCNGNGVQDDLSDVRTTPCKNGMRQEYYGLDDECVLWTTNTFVPKATGRPIGLSRGLSAPNDAWAGSYVYSNFVRIDGYTGLVRDEAQLSNDCHPYGVTIDGQGIAWAPTLGSGPLCYFDTTKPVNVGIARDPDWGPMSSYGVTMDREQNVWVGALPARYAPDRTNGFQNLGMGRWTRIANISGIGIAADSRNASDYFVYSCSGNGVLQIPASKIKYAKMDQTIPVGDWATIDMPCYGVGVDLSQNIWGISMDTATRALVDKNGKITQPTRNAAPMKNNVCPAGDQCPMNGGPYTYSDFTGFGLRAFTIADGTWSIVVVGCGGYARPRDTDWSEIDFDATAPAGTSLTVHARSGNTAIPDETWGHWTASVGDSPLIFGQGGGGALVPNFQETGDAYLQIDVTLNSPMGSASPKINRLDLSYTCPNHQ